jgi:hypothetical protein
MNFINNSNVEVYVEGWVSEIEGLTVNKIKTVKPGESILVQKSITGNWTISDTDFERIGELYDTPTSYKKIYYMIFNDTFKCEYIISNDKLINFTLHNL